MKTLYFSLILVLGFFFSCDKGTSDTTSDTPTVKDSIPQTIVDEQAPPDTRIPLRLDGLYATSTEQNTDVRNIFNKDEKSVWMTRNGAGPDEGIMLYFSDSTYIKSIRVEQATTSGLASIAEVELYGNGSPLFEFNPGEPTEVEAGFWNIYLRFNVSEKIERINRPIKNDYYSSINIDRFDAQSQIGISRIIIEGADGEFRVIPPSLINGAVQASSTLKPESFAYDPGLLFDSRKEFVWVEGTDGNGVDERLVFNFEKEVNIAGLQLWNGYQRSDSHFKSNARLKDFEFKQLDGTGESFKLKDVQGAQKIKLKQALKGKSFELIIKSAYPGWSYKDLAVSEILFFDEADALFGLKVKNTSENRAKIIAKAKGSILEKLLDSRIFNEYQSTDYEMMYMTRSAILRSDGTFVMYESEEDGGEPVQTIADGNWEIIDAGPDQATISVFGKLLDFSMLEMYYAGKTDAELSRIFRDEITVKGTTIKGEKLVNAIEF